MQQRNNKFYFNMISKASHKIGALLTVIKEGVSLVSEGTAGQINDTQRKSLVFAGRAVNRLTQLMSDLIDVEKIIDKEIRLRKEKIDVYNLINYICSHVQQEVAVKNIRLNNKLSNNLSAIYVDRDRTSRAIINLMEEIIKFSPEREQVHITATENNDLEISIRSSNIVKGVKYDNLSLIEQSIEDLIQTNNISLNIIIAKALIECEGGKFKLFRFKDNKNEVIFTLPKYKGGIQ